MKKFFLLTISHVLSVVIGFALGIYALPILTAPDTPTAGQVAEVASRAEYSGEFTRDLEGSDVLHWGEGKISVGPEFIALEGRIAPGPDYKLYLSPEFVQTEAEFERLKSQMVQVGDVKVFENFLVPVPGTIDPSGFNTAIVWCEAFGEFITAARYQ